MSGPDKKKIYSGVQHSDDPKDKDYAGKREVKDAAKAAYHSIQQSISGLNSALKDVGAGHLKYDVDPYLTKEEHDAVLYSTGGSAALGLGVAAIASPIIGGSVFLASLAQFAGKMTVWSSDSHIKHMIKQDFKGKREAEILYALPDGFTLKMPVTPHNLDVMVEAYGTATDYVNATKGAHFTEDMETGVRKAMLSYIVEHGQGMVKVPPAAMTRDVAAPFSKKDVALSTPIGGGTDVVDAPHSGLSGNKPAVPTQRSV